MKIITKSSLLLSLIAPLFLVGCSGEKKADLYLFSGTVTHNGSPIPDLEILFVPEDTGKFREATAVSDSQGKFEMTYIRDKGAVPGKNQVVVRDPEQINGGKTSTEPNYLAVIKKYGNEDTTPLEIVIEADQENYELKLD
ncbi:MAG: hypothetical protein ACKVH8_08200 [Pirellulales bacterium]